jgi:SAM-dependent methyltransferase
VSDAPDFYAALAGADDDARVAGWEHPLGQAARFEAALAAVGAGDTVLDVGCGPGALLPYLEAVRPGARYVGVERLPGMLAKARARCPRGDFRERDALDGGPLPEADVVVAIGALVDGASLREDGVRFGRLRRLAERCLAASRRCAVLVALDQDVVDARLMFRAEEALGGLRASEAAWLAEALGVEVEVHRVLTTDLALTLWRPGVARVPLATDYAARALAGPLGVDATPEDVAWLGYAAGDAAAARAALQYAEDSWRVRWLRDAIAAMQ